MLSVRIAGDGGTPATLREGGKENSGKQEDCNLSGYSTLRVGCLGRGRSHRRLIAKEESIHGQEDVTKNAPQEENEVMYR
jgi:hypothetical protein